MIVHVLSSAASARGDRKAGPAARQERTAQTPAGTLPPLVAEMREAILAAAETGDIDELRTVLDWNELKPEVADAPVGDIIAYWRSLSADGTGREMLAALRAILSTTPAVVRGGRDVENDRLFVWPGIAEQAIGNLDASALADLARIAPEPEVERMKAARRYLGWRLVIGADGVWHSLRRAQ
jgi:hypothetical protein